MKDSSHVLGGRWGKGSLKRFYGSLCYRGVSSCNSPCHIAKSNYGNRGRFTLLCCVHCLFCFLGELGRRPRLEVPVMAVTTMVDAGKKVDSIDRGSKHVIGANRGDFSGMSYASKEKSNEPTVQQVEHVASENGKPVAVVPKKGRFATLWTHYKHWWICYTIGGVILLAILLPILYVLLRIFLLH